MSAESLVVEWRERIKSAQVKNEPLRIRGGGTKDFYGERLEGEIFDVSGHSGIVDYDPTELVIEPGINFNWLYTAYYAVNGGARWDARNMGVELGYHVVPQVKLRASYWLNRLAHEDVAWLKREDVVDMRNATLGVTLLF